VEIDLQTKQQLATLLAKPSLVTQNHAPMLNELVKNYPYYQPLHLLLAKASPDADHLATAALYNGGSLLHQIVHQPESLATKPLHLVNKAAIKADEQPLEFIPTETSSTDDQETFEEIAEIKAPSAQDYSTAEEETFEEIAEVPQPPITADRGIIEAEQEEIYDEIAEIDVAPFKTTIPDEEIIPDELAIESIVATDFFAFEKNFHDEQPIENHKAVAQIVVQPEEYNQEAEEQTVSKYDDDKLPYTFLWWLAKTRKEHEQIFQPYVTPKKSNENPGELQQQYVEHIFHLQTPFNVADEVSRGPVNTQVAHRGEEIIDSFIKNEPQIRAPKPEQINNENKAKKSAEDHNDLVSETLAAIYIEQMLYHKAIDTYEKLSLKFPEKSRYFADLIQSLEKKI
jgi:hypothetical protein